MRKGQTEFGRVNAIAGQILEVTMDGLFDTSVYVVTDCMDIGTSCATGSDLAQTGNDSFTFAIPADGTYFIIADAFDVAPVGEFTLDIALFVPTCTPGSAACNGATDIDVCSSSGAQFDLFTCASGVCDAGSNLCEGDVCATAVDATAGGQFTGTFDASIQDDYDVVGAAACTGFETPGSDMAYLVDLTVGQTLTATLNGSDADTSLYVLSDCADPVNSCLVGDDAFPTGEIVSYTAAATETVYVIVDAFDDSAGGTFTLDITVQ